MMHQRDGRPRRRSALGLPGRRARGTHGRRVCAAGTPRQGGESLFSGPGAGTPGARRAARARAIW